MFCTNLYSTRICTLYRRTCYSSSMLYLLLISLTVCSASNVYIPGIIKKRNYLFLKQHKFILLLVPSSSPTCAPTSFHFTTAHYENYFFEQHDFVILFVPFSSPPTSFHFTTAHAQLALGAVTPVLSCDSLIIKPNF